MNTHLIDIFPTLLAVAGAPYPELDPTGSPAPPLEGMDLSPYFTSSLPLPRGVPVFQRWKQGRSVRTDDWKLLSWTEPGQRAEEGIWRLYDMTADRTETNDVAAEHPAIVAEMAAAYDEWLARVKPD